MSAVETCLATEAKIREVQRLLLESRPETLDRCAAELSEVVTALEELVSAGPRQWSPAETELFQQMKRAASGLQGQIDHASHLWTGWLQLWMGAGYTKQGLPVFANREARSCFEG